MKASRGKKEQLAFIHQLAFMNLQSISHTLFLPLHLTPLCLSLPNCELGY